MPSQYKVNGVVRTITEATATLTDYEAGGLVVVNRAAGSTITLPDATGTGYVYTIITIVDQTGDLVIQAPDADNVMQGVAMTDMTGVIWPTADATDTITLNGTTSGGLKGARVTLIDVAADTWQVEVVSESSGTEVTPFSAAV
ncbi:hypothetical protein PVV74_17395 [Roseovarius sp. SK2]|uniref:hypothetical protein n=1 Tax=Roseovarius TaxID=74030 RepID=UPI00237AF194|nr:hypothetical protein [Roseovarius sp. SK2]MDD9727238.1 hypothetical protein [Roseovarius sp. SK2]